MIAILGGLGAAVLWAVTTLCSSRSTRMIAPSSVLAWVMLIGLVVTVPFLVAAGVPEALDAGTVGWLALAGVGNVAGLLLSYAALRVGKVAIVAPIVSTEGAIAAVIAVIAGESIAPGAGAMLGVIAAGVVMAGVVREPATAERPGHPVEATMFAVGAALLFGCSLYATGRISDDLPLAWVLLPPRLVGVVAVALPLALVGGLRLTRPAAPLVAASGLAEVLGFGAFALGARHGIAVAAVLASQFAALAALAAFLLFRERLNPIQVAGVAAIAVGVATLSGLQA